MAATASLAPVSDEPTLSHTSYAPVSSIQEAGNKHVSYENKFPIFARQVLVGGFDDSIVEDVRLGAEHGVCVSPGDGAGSLSQAQLWV
jgi:hypothetical protein